MEQSQFFNEKVILMDYKEIWNDGYDAKLEGLTLDDNPFYGWRRDQWAEGWKTADCVKDTPIIRDGVFICLECSAPLDRGDECSNPNCRLHPINGGYKAHYND